MNHVRFMFNKINKYELLYEDVVEYDKDWGDDVTSIQDYTKDYVTQIMNDIAPNLLKQSELKALGCLERIANEVFILKTDSAEYKITFTIDTFRDKDARIIIDIVPKYNYEGIEKCYDRYLEKLKIEIKKRMTPDWKCCNWLIDEPSETLCTELYSEFFKLENRIRSFVSRVLTLHLGVDWLSSCGLEKYYNSATQLSDAFKQKVPELDDINADLISLTLESVFDIVFKCQVYENDIVLSRGECVQLEKILASNKGNENVKEFILKRRKKVADIWGDIFEQYFDKPEKFKTDVNKFINSRNHVAHNKLITWNTYNAILAELDEIEGDLDYADDRFDEKEMSKEVRLTREYEAEQESEEQEYWRSRIAEETGIEILDEEGIYDKFCETLDDFYQDVLKQFQYDPCFDIEEMKMPAYDGETHFFDIKCKALEQNSVEVYVDMLIDDDMGESSSFSIVCKTENVEIFTANCQFVNGSGYEGEDHLMQAEQDSEYNISEVEELKDKLLEYVTEQLNPMIVKLNSIQQNKEKLREFVADNECEECGHLGVSINAEFYPIGKCCYCGNEK